MNRQPAPTIRKFNPGLLQSDDEIREQFVVRRHELAVVLDELRGNIASPSCQHILVVGPRGRGKTMLLARIAAELRGREDFAGSLLPVRFMEESHQIFSLTDFWLETMFHLANEVDEREAALARQLRDTRAALSPRWRERITEAHARAAVLEAAERLDRRLVLIVENLQSLCRDAHADFDWQLRQVLQTEPQIILLGSATSRFRAVDRVDEPFFEMFRIVGLDPLDTDECGRLWKVVSGKRAGPSEVRPLQILTGGNPRLLVMAAEFARHRSLRRLMSELVTVIDEHTEYFRGHLEALPKTERRVYLAVIDLWRPSSASEIAATARVDIRVASTMLGRLVERGAVVRQGRGRKRLYAAAEPLYSMYYKLRRERDEAAVVENLIRFMVACYGVGDLRALSGAMSVEASESVALRRGIGRALSGRLSGGRLSVEQKLKWRVIRRVSEETWAHAESTATENLQNAVDVAFERGEFEAAVRLVDEFLSSGWQDAPEPISDSATAWASYLQAYAHEQLEDPWNVLATSDRAVGLADSRNRRVLVWTALALAMRAKAHLCLGDFRAAIATCDALVHRFDSLKEWPVRAATAEALVTRGCAKAHADDDLGAIRDYDDVADRFGDSQAPDIRETVVAALMSKALACRRLGDVKEEIRSYDAVIERLDPFDALDIPHHGAVALSWKCMAQADGGLADEALASCRRLERAAHSWPRDEEGPRAEPWIEWLQWRAESARSLALAVQENHRASLNSFRTAYAVFPAHDEVTTQEMLNLVVGLVARGSPPRKLLAVLSSDTARAAGLRPLIVALHELSGDPVRASREVAEVAADIRERFTTLA